jgi:hypothetical protein
VKLRETHEKLKIAHQEYPKKNVGREEEAVKKIEIEKMRNTTIDPSQTRTYHSEFKSRD